MITDVWRWPAPFVDKSGVNQAFTRYRSGAHGHLLIPITRLCFCQIFRPFNPGEDIEEGRSGAFFRSRPSADVVRLIPPPRSPFICEAIQVVRWRKARVAAVKETWPRVIHKHSSWDHLAAPFWIAWVLLYLSLVSLLVQPSKRYLDPAIP